MKHFIFFISSAFLFSSCASLYVTPPSPTPFLEKNDGLALQGSIGTNDATNFVSLSATKAVSNEVSLNVSGTTSFMSNHKSVANNPFTLPNNVNQFAANVGFNTRKLTVYPMQLWLGVHAGNSADSYVINPLDVISTNDVKASLNPLDSLNKFEYAKGSYVGTRIALTHIIISNYDNNVQLKNRIKTKFDIVGTASITPFSYKYSNSNLVTNANNTLLGYDANIRVYQAKWILGLNLDMYMSGKNLVDDIMGNKTPITTLYQVAPYCIPTIHYTRFFKR